MCGRYYIDQEEDIAEMRRILEEVNRKFYGTDALGAVKTGDIAPTHIVPVLRPDQNVPAGRIMIDLMQWGFPQYRGKGVLINARAETAAEKPLFRTALRQGRILIPASAFFEWRHDPDGRKGSKVKLSLDNEPIFYMAGISRTFSEDAHAITPLRRFVILTTAANASVAPIHDRMPLILPRRFLRSWLLDDTATDELLRLAVENPLRLTETA
ncbi:MAG: SOS response-associated peptidase [Clostridiaceae bacterium]|nr:SOS response-associated peptidase [Clostridiaceae bacterium]